MLCNSVPLTKAEDKYKTKNPIRIAIPSFLALAELLSNDD
jgi:hypothetical protein